METTDPQNVNNIVKHILDGDPWPDSGKRQSTLAENYAVILAKFIRKDKMVEDDPANPISANQEILKGLISLRDAADGEEKLVLRRAIRRIEVLETTLLEIRDAAEQVE